MVLFVGVGEGQKEREGGGVGLTAIRFISFDRMQSKRKQRTRVQNTKPEDLHHVRIHNDQLRTLPSTKSHALVSVVAVTLGQSQARCT